MAWEYDELRIRLWSIGHGRYFVLANGSVCDSAVIDLPDALEFHAKLNDLLQEEFRRRPREKEPIRQRLRQLGTELWNRLSIERGFQQNLAKARESKRGLRLKFYLPPELTGIPVELLETGKNFLGRNVMVSVARCVEGDPFKPQPNLGDAPLTIVIVGASPSGYDELKIKQEIAELGRALTFAQALGDVVVKTIDGVTRQNLTNPPFAVKGACAVIMIGHGEHDGEVGKVVLQHPDGTADPISEELFADLLPSQWNVSFVALMLCEGGRGNFRDPRSGVAGQLIGKKVPMVIGFQYEVGNQAARLFTKQLLIGIAQKCWLDEACAIGRLMMADTPDTAIEWCSPMLFLSEDRRDTRLTRALENQAPFTLETNEYARRLAQQNRLTQTWQYAADFLEGAVRAYPEDRELEALFREARIEVDLIRTCSEICSRLARGDADDALRLIKSDPSVTIEPGLVKPLSDLLTGPQPSGKPKARPDPVSDDPWEELLRCLAGRLLTPGACLLYGEPRTGKTWIANKAGERIGYRIVLEDCGSWTPKKILAALGKERPQKTLLIMDDVRSMDPVGILPYLATPVIITSRRRDLHIVPPENRFQVKGLKPEEAFNLFRRLQPEKDLTPYRPALLEMASRVEGAVPALLEALPILQSQGSIRDHLYRIRLFNAPKEREQWKGSIADARSGAGRLFHAFAAGAPYGSLAAFAAEVAGMDDTDVLRQALNELVDGSLLQCVSSERQQYKLHSLLCGAYRNDGVRNVHFDILHSTGWIGHRDCLGEVAVAACWLLENGAYPKVGDLIHKAMPTLRRLEDVEESVAPGFDRPGVGRPHSGSPHLIQRYFYVKARLLQIVEPLDSAKQDLEHYISLCGELEWQDKAVAKGLLALTCIGRPEEAIGLLTEQEDLYRKHSDLAGQARTLGIRACIWLHMGLTDDAQKDLRKRWQILLPNKPKDQLPTIEETQGYIPRLWEDVLLLQDHFARAPRDFDRSFFSEAQLEWELQTQARSSLPDLEIIMATSSSGESAYTAQTPSGAPDSIPLEYRKVLEKLKEALDLLLDLLNEHEKKPIDLDRKKEALDLLLDLLNEQEKKLIGQDRKEDQCAGYANEAAIHLLQKEYEKALKAVEKQEKLCEELDDRRGLQECCRKQALIFSALYSPLGAKMFDRMTAIGKTLQFEEAFAYASWRWGLLATFREDTDTALHYLKQAASLMDGLDLPDERAKIIADIDSLSCEPDRGTSAGRS